MVETMMHRAHREQIKTLRPSPRLSARHFPLSAFPSLLKARTSLAIFFLALPSLCKLAGGFAEAEEERRRLPSRVTPLACLLSLSGFPDLLRG
jgi:hypothetical protein